MRIFQCVSGFSYGLNTYNIEVKGWENKELELFAPNKVTIVGRYVRIMDQGVKD